MNLDQRMHDTTLEDYCSRNEKTTGPSDNGFTDLGITQNLIEAINRLDFENPTPIQKEAIPIGIRGNDIIAIAQTGSGKTLAYGIPMLQRFSKNTRGTGLIIVPTRELAIQVEESLQAFSRPLNIGTAVLIGGASITLQQNVLRKNPRIIIATPGRLLDHIERRTVNLTDIEIFVLDEADRMLDMGFAPDIKRIMRSIPDKRQTMLFSATISKEIEAIAEKFMETPTRLEVDRSGKTPAEVSHEMFIIKNQDKGRLLAVQLKQFSGPVLVFTRTKWTARKLTAKVNNMGFATAEIHSNRSLLQRRTALEGFKRGRYQILIATDIAARGIDVSGIELVVNYDMPASSEDYVHRIGRTGRAGKTGHAISFATIEQEGSIRNIERFMNTKLTISTTPALPSEKHLGKETGQSNSKNESSRDENNLNRELSNYRSSKRRNRKYADSKISDKKWTESKQKDFMSRDKNRQETKPRNSKSTEINHNSANNEINLWSDFRKRRPAKKKSVGQGSGRKRHAGLK